MSVAAFAGGGRALLNTGKLPLLFTVDPIRQEGSHAAMAMAPTSPSK